MFRRTIELQKSHSPNLAILFPNEHCYLGNVRNDFSSSFHPFFTFPEAYVANPPSSNNHSHFFRTEATLANPQNATSFVNESCLSLAFVMTSDLTPWMGPFARPWCENRVRRFASTESPARGDGLSHKGIGTRSWTRGKGAEVSTLLYISINSQFSTA